MLLLLMRPEHLKRKSLPKAEALLNRPIEKALKKGRPSYAFSLIELCIIFVNAYYIEW